MKTVKMKLPLVLCGIVLFLTSCSEPTRYVKAGATPEDLQKDTVECNNQIAVTGPAARRASGAMAPGTMGGGAVIHAGTVEHEKRLDECLQEKGWSRDSKSK